MFQSDWLELANKIAAPSQNVLFTILNQFIDKRLLENGVFVILFKFHFKQAAEFYPDQKKTEKNLKKKNDHHHICSKSGSVKNRLKNRVIAFVLSKAIIAISVLF